VFSTGEVWPPAAGLVEVNEIPAIFLYNAAGNDPAVIRSRRRDSPGAGFYRRGVGLANYQMATHRLPYLQRSGSEQFQAFGGP